MVACLDKIKIYKNNKKERKDMNNDYKRLVRSKTNRSICGVCGGIGEYLNVDPTLIRVVWVIGAFISVGTGALAYLIAALIIPEDVE